MALLRYGKELRFDDAFKFGKLVSVRLENAILKGPSEGKKWLILYGNIYHVTGTPTSLFIAPTIHQDTVYDALIAPKFIELWSEATGTASSRFNLFSMVAAEGRPQWTPLILTNEGCLMLAGDATCWADIIVLEW